MSNKEDLRQQLADIPFNKLPGITGSLAANMEPEYFDGLLDFFYQVMQREVKKAKIDQTYRCERQTRLIDSLDMRKLWLKSEAETLKSQKEEK